MDSASIDHWRQLFRSASIDIFEVIENAITIAALDYPHEFRIRRDHIVEKLFLCQLNWCSGCDGVLLKGNENGSRNLRSVDDLETVKGKGSQVYNSVKDNNGDVGLNTVSKCSYHEAVALTAEIEEANEIVGEVMRIKELLYNCEDQSEDVAIRSLQRLQLMSLTLETLQATKIGMTVKLLCKHRSKFISNLARALVKEWKDLVDQWCSGEPNTKGEEGSPDSVNPSVVEEGLPFPPLDEGAMFATQTTSIELSRFFEGMDDDGNLKNCSEHNTRYENERKPTLQNQRLPTRELQPTCEVNFGTKESKGLDLMTKDSIKKQSKISNTGVGSARPPKPISRNKLGDETRLQQELDTFYSRKMSLSGHQGKSKGLSEVVKVKLEGAKRRLHSGYQQVENAKKQRTIQVMELHEIPKRTNVLVNSRMRLGSQSHSFPSGRR